MIRPGSVVSKARSTLPPVAATRKRLWSRLRGPHPTAQPPSLRRFRQEVELVGPPRLPVGQAPSASDPTLEVPDRRGPSTPLRDPQAGAREAVALVAAPTPAAGGPAGGGGDDARAGRQPRDLCARGHRRRRVGPRPVGGGPRHLVPRRPGRA